MPPKKLPPHHPLSDEEVLKISGPRTKFFTYDQLSNASVPPVGQAYLILYRHNEDSGHWVYLLRRTDGALEYGDSYGAKPDKPLLQTKSENAKLGQIAPFLSRIMKTASSAGIPLEYQQKHWQKGQTTECGYHVGVRLYFRNLNLDDYQKALEAGAKALKISPSAYVILLGDAILRGEKPSLKLPKINMVSKVPARKIEMPKEVEKVLKELTKDKTKKGKPSRVAAPKETLYSGKESRAERALYDFYLANRSDPEKKLQELKAKKVSELTPTENAVAQLLRAIEHGDPVRIKHYRDLLHLHLEGKTIPAWLPTDILGKPSVGIANRARVIVDEPPAPIPSEPPLPPPPQRRPPSPPPSPSDIPDEVPIRPPTTFPRPPPRESGLTPEQIAVRTAHRAELNRIAREHKRAVIASEVVGQDLSERTGRIYRDPRRHGETLRARIQDPTDPIHLPVQLPGQVPSEDEEFGDDFNDPNFDEAIARPHGTGEAYKRWRSKWVSFVSHR